MVPSYPAVLFAYRQHCRFVQAEATTLPAMNSNREKKKSFPTFFESVTDGLTEIHELSCVYAEVGMLLTKKTRLTSEMLSTSQASEPGLIN